MIKHSSSKYELDGEIGLEDGPDLSQYAIQLAKERNSRTLTLRIKRPTIAAVFSKTPPNRRSLVQETSPSLAPESVIRSLSNGNPEEIKVTLSALSTALESSPATVASITRSSDVAEAFCNSISSDLPQDVLVSVLGMISTLYPLSGEVQDAYIDNGLPFSLLNFLITGLDELSANQDKSIPIIGASLQIISVIASNHFYGRDSLLCNGLIEPLIQIATHPDFMEQACSCICAIFENPAPLESESIMEVIPQIANLLTLSSKSAVEQILLAYVFMTNKYTAVVSNLYDIELPAFVIPLLDDPDLVAVALKVVGNLSVAQPPQIRMMLELDLLNKLRSLLNSQPIYIPDVFWIFSNLIEANSSAILPIIDEAFLRNVLGSATNGDIETKKEASFFLSTVILFSNPESYGLFITADIVDLLVEMLACGVGMIIFRCIDTILAFVRYMNLNPDSISQGVAIILDTDIMDRLDELSKNEDPIMAERAAYLTTKLNQLSENKE